MAREELWKGDTRYVANTQAENGRMESFVFLPVCLSHVL